MEKTNVTKRVTATILSMSLLTVMAGAAIAPALGIIKAHFSEADALLVHLAVRLEGEVEAISAKLPEHVHECTVVLRGRHLDLPHPQTIDAHHRLLRQLLCITIIGIPWGKMHFRLAKLALSPFGMEVV